MNEIKGSANECRLVLVCAEEGKHLWSGFKANAFLALRGIYGEIGERETGAGLEG